MIRRFYSIVAQLSQCSRFCIFSDYEMRSHIFLRVLNGDFARFQKKQYKTHFCTFRL